MNMSIFLQRCGVVNRICKFMIMKKLYLLLLLTITSIPSFASRGELYAWNELNNTGDTSIISFVFYGILALVLGIALLGGWLMDVSKGNCTKESNKLGCLGFSIILILILGIIVRCSLTY